MKLFAAIVIALLVCDWGCAQERVAAQAEPAIVLQNTHLKVTRLSAANGVREAGRDIVVVPLPSSGADISRMQDPFFVAKGTRLPETEGSDFLLITLTKHRDVSMRTCQEPANCVRKIMVGDAEVGERKQLFTSGFVTGSLQILKKGGSLTSSYYSAKGIDHVLIVTFTDTTFLLDGVEHPLKAGQATFTEAKEVEVNAGLADEARWFTLRLNEPR